MINDDDGRWAISTNWCRRKEKWSWFSDIGFFAYLTEISNAREKIDWIH